MMPINPMILSFSMKMREGSSIGGLSPGLMDFSACAISPQSQALVHAKTTKKRL
jgi:hypothetical protein